MKVRRNPPKWNCHPRCLSASPNSPCECRCRGANHNPRTLPRVRMQPARRIRARVIGTARNPKRKAKPKGAVEKFLERDDWGIYEPTLHEIGRMYRYANARQKAEIRRRWGFQLRILETQKRQAVKWS